MSNIVFAELAEMSRLGDDVEPSSIPARGMSDMVMDGWNA
jgi:hypothetical protein